MKCKLTTNYLWVLLLRQAGALHICKLTTNYLRVLLLRQAGALHIYIIK